MSVSNNSKQQNSQSSSQTEFFESKTQNRSATDIINTQELPQILSEK